MLTGYLFVVEIVVEPSAAVDAAESTSILVVVVVVDVVVVESGGRVVLFSRQNIRLDPAMVAIKILDRILRQCLEWFRIKDLQDVH